MYVQKINPFIVNGVSYYEMVLTPAYDVTSNLTDLLFIQKI